MFTTGNPFSINTTEITATHKKIGKAMLYESILSRCSMNIITFGDTMNIEQAKAIAITTILDKLNHAPQRTNGHRLLYFSPLRQERTPSLWVNAKLNSWRDFGDVEWGGGDGIHLVRAYLSSQGVDCQVSDALRWLSNMTGFIPSIRPVVDSEEREAESSIELRHAVKITNRRLLEYSESRGIAPQVLHKYFEQANLYNKNSQKTFTAICMRNDRKGYELRNEKFKGCVGKKYITFIRGVQPKPDTIDIFEGGFDFATACTLNHHKPMLHDTIVLHSLSNLKKATAYIKNYGYSFCRTWMDNDDAGKAATLSWEDFCTTETDLKHIPMNDLYSPYKDVNAAHMARLGL